MNDSLLEYLSGFVSERRKELFAKIVAMRTRYITVAIEDVYQSHNASAVLRTCDCLGVQDVHIIENYNTFETNPEVALGASNWLTIHKYNYGENSSSEAIKRLKDGGYRIVATSPHINEVHLEDFSLDKGRTALFFGTEKEGLSQAALKHADEFLRIPMRGFTESFNISVSAAIILYQLTGKLHKSDIRWELTKTETEEVMLEWLRKSIKRADLLEKEFFERGSGHDKKIKKKGKK